MMTVSKGFLTCLRTLKRRPFQESRKDTWSSFQRTLMLWRRTEAKRASLITELRSIRALPTSILFLLEAEDHQIVDKTFLQEGCHNRPWTSWIKAKRSLGGHQLLSQCFLKRYRNRSWWTYLLSQKNSQSQKFKKWQRKKVAQTKTNCKKTLL